MHYTANLTNSLPRANGGALFWKQHGRTFEILAIRESADSANEFLEKNPDAAVIAEMDRSVIIVRKADDGTPWRKGGAS